MVVLISTTTWILPFSNEATSLHCFPCNDFKAAGRCTMSVILQSNIPFLLSGGPLGTSIHPHVYCHSLSHLMLLLLSTSSQFWLMHLPSASCMILSFLCLFCPLYLSHISFPHHFPPFSFSFPSFVLYTLLPLFFLPTCFSFLFHWQPQQPPNLWHWLHPVPWFLLLCSSFLSLVSRCILTSISSLRSTPIKA